MIHVMHILGNFGPGGAEMGVVRMINTFPEQSIKHSVCSIGSNMTMKDLLEKETECISLGLDGGSHTAFMQLKKIFVEKSVDIAHVNNIAPWFDVALASKLSGCKCVQTFHGVEENRLKFSFLKKAQMFLALKMTDYLNSVSQSAADLLSRLSGINDKTINVITNGVDTDHFRPATQEQKDSIKKDFGFLSDNIIIGCVSGLRKVKNHKGLITAFKKVIQKNSKCILVVVGTGPLEEALKRQCRELGIEEHVVFTGSQKNVVKCLNLFDLFVLNSRTEGLSYAILEAMAAGLPVIVTDVGGNTDLIETGTDGVLIEDNNVEMLSDTILKLCENKKMAEAIGLNAREKILNKYSIDVMLQNYSDLYQRLL